MRRPSSLYGAGLRRPADEVEAGPPVVLEQRHGGGRRAGVRAGEHGRPGRIRRLRHPALRGALPSCVSFRGLFRPLRARRRQGAGTGRPALALRRIRFPEREHGGVQRERRSDLHEPSSRQDHQATGQGGVRAAARLGIHARPENGSRHIDGRRRVQRRREEEHQPAFLHPGRRADVDPSGWRRRLDLDGVQLRDRRGSQCGLSGPGGGPPFRGRHARAVLQAFSRSVRQDDHFHLLR